MNTNNMHLQTTDVYTNDDAQKNIIDYYDKTSLDYAGWSKNYHMHFGYFRFKGWRHFFKNIWRLESQLDQASEEVFNSLNIKQNGQYLDMGCGFGATARIFAKTYHHAKLTGITIVASQVEQAQKLLKAECPTANNVCFKQMDYQDTSFTRDSFDGVYAIESACHSRGEGKQAFLAESYRLLKSGGKLVVHDAFTSNKSVLGDYNFIYKYAYHWLCKGWAVESYINKKAFTTALKHQGFINIKFENAFWHVLPSALHIPRVVITYAVTQMLFSKAFYTNKHLRKQRINHLFGSCAAAIVALHTKRFGYYVVTANKP